MRRLSTYAVYTQVCPHSGLCDTTITRLTPKNKKSKAPLLLIGALKALTLFFSSGCIQLHYNQMSRKLRRRGNYNLDLNIFDTVPLHCTSKLIQ